MEIPNRTGLHRGVLAGLALIASQAQADPVYNIQWWGVPDYDQRRSMGLHNGQFRPGLCLGGKSYCVPSAGANWLSFVDAHGYPILADKSYNSITAMIDQLGSLMETNCDSGTRGDKYGDGLRSKLNAHPASAGKFFTIQMRTTGDVLVGPQEMAVWMFIGGMITPSIGWYEQNQNEDFVYKRVSGHAVSLTSMIKYNGYGVSPSEATVRIANPSGSDGDNLTDGELQFQSPFATSKYVLKKDYISVEKPGHFPEGRFQFIFEGMNPAPCFDLPNGLAACSEWQGYLDGFTALMSSVAFGLPQNEDLKFRLVLPDALDNSPMAVGSVSVPGRTQSIRRDFSVPFRTSEVSEFQLHPLLPAAYLRTHTAMYYFDPMRGARQLIAVAGPGAIAVGREHRVYVADGQHLRLIIDDPYNIQAPSATRIQVGAIDAVVFDEARARLVMLAGRNLLEYAEDLSGAPRVIALDPDVSVGPATRLAFDPATAALWLIEPTRLTRLSALQDATSVGSVESFSPGIGTKPESVQFADGGVVVAHNGTDIVEFARDGRGQYQPRPSSYAGHGLGAWFRVGRSSLHPQERDEPLISVPPAPNGTEYPECVADISDEAGLPRRDGIVDAHDLRAFLRAYQTRSPLADVDNGSGRAIQDRVVNEHDLQFFRAVHAHGCE